MLRARPGDRVQVREGRDEGFALTGLRTPPGTVRAVYGTGVEAGIVVDLDGEWRSRTSRGNWNCWRGSNAA